MSVWCTTQRQILSRASSMSLSGCHFRSSRQWLLGSKTLDEIDVFTTQDDPLDGIAPPVEPTEELTFKKYGIIDFEVQYWDGSKWVTVPGGNVTGNNKVWRKFPLSPAVTTNKIRVLIHRAAGPLSRVVEIEAYERGTRSNVALAT